MNSHERIQTILEHKTPDRMGLFEHFWPETLGGWLDRGYPKRGDNGHAAPPGEVFDYDIQPGGAGVDWSPRPGYNEVVDEGKDWRLVRNGAGAVLRYWKFKSGTPEHVHFEMTTRDYWEKLKPALLEVNPSRIGNLENVAQNLANLRAKGKFVTTGSLFIYEVMRYSLGDICMLENFLLDPEWIKDFFRTYTDFFISHFQLIFEKGGKPDAMFIYDDLAYTNGLWASPKLMGELVIPFHAELVEFVHGHGIPIILHSCGDVRRGIDMIVEAGYDCLQPMEAKVGNNVLEYAEKYGDRIAFMGNINVMTLETGDRDLIRKEIESKVKPLRDMKIPYIFHSDHSIPPTIDYASYKYALEVFQEYMEY